MTSRGTQTEATLVEGMQCPCTLVAISKNNIILHYTVKYSQLSPNPHH